MIRAVSINSVFILVLFLYAYSGMEKWLIFFVDPTLVFGLLTLTTLPFFFNKKIINAGNKLNIVIGLILSIHLFILISAFYTVSDSYYIIKIGKIFFNLIALLMPIIILSNEKSFEVLKKYCWYAFIFCLLLLLIELISNNLDRIRFSSGEITEINPLPDYMSISYFLGTMILMWSETRDKLKIFLLFIGFIFMLLLAAKGPILFLAICLFWQYRHKIKIFKLGNLFYILGAILIIQVFSIITNNSVFLNLAGRLLFFSDGLDADQSSLERVFLFGKAIEIIQSNFFFGVGIGGFAKAFSGVDARLSAHNIFLEIWSELGVFPILILIFLFIYSRIQYKKIIKMFPNTYSNSILSIVFYMFLGLLVSSYLEDLRLTYFWVGISVAYSSVMFKKLKA